MTDSTSTEKDYAPYGIFLLRLSLGIMFLAHAGLKIFVFTPAGTAGFFESVGFPGFFAYATIAGEVAAGVALMAGVYTRLAALATLPILLGATYVHAGNGWVFSNPNGGWEFPIFLVVAVIVQALLGSGAYAVQLSTNSAEA
jgi:putative oxidoreductase